ncbi:SDR family NAD(P)-dependent oxidoreductase [Goodfellowiella coeruleoviolacea]|uniref:Short-chain dehydrogenase n=1 Tax=Goodfellowiella coeruleoviolacea TaxID=334858 RepID=A0AAE3GB61_9PSEU|nr:SDR family NAD(P)-dependent oxidoreductase [Goodfellowiella coeruleoviolacea]MCP2164905.1 Short-chain dehydrogenase [Goodfellowiella coeruleoviolacea]
MRTVIISGGTAGIGQGLARHLLGRGDHVVVIGRDQAKGRAFRAEADRLGAADRATSLTADLSLVAENRRVIAAIENRFAQVDALVLGAQFYRTRRTETAEGFEHTFALYYLSRFLLSFGLEPLLARAARPVVLNICGPGVEVGEIHWDDPQLTRDYQPLTAMFQGSRANDLLGVAFAELAGTGAVPYVLVNPGGVATSFAGDYADQDPVLTAQINQFRQTAAPVEEAIVPLVRLLDDPPAEPLSAFQQDQRLSLDHPAFDRANALRLHRMTTALLGG